MSQDQPTGPQFTDREVLVAQYAAELAVSKVMDSFYRDVGRTFVSRWLIVIGAAVVAYSAGKGWLTGVLK